MAVLFFALVLSLASIVPQPGFLGLRIGMKTREALVQIGKKPDALKHIPFHSGEQVISDSVPIPSCALSMRRSLGFDSSGTLVAVGLTYKTTPSNIENASSSIFHWLTKTYGNPGGSVLRDSVRQSVWKFGGVMLTFESRNYNPRDYFVLVYYYKDDQATE